MTNCDFFLISAKQNRLLVVLVRTSALINAVLTTGNPCIPNPCRHKFFFINVGSKSHATFSSMIESNALYHAKGAAS